MRRFRFLWLFLAAPALAGQAQSPPASSVQESTTVSLVEVPATVLDKEGKPVRGLAASDFELRDDGKEVAIQSLSVTDFAPAVAPGSGAAAEQPVVEAAARRRFLLLFDLSYSTPAKLTKIREASRKFVLQQLAPPDLAAIAVFSVEKGLDLVLAFTPDRAQLVLALQTLGISRTGETMADPLQLTEVLGAQVGTTEAIGSDGQTGPKSTSELAQINKLYAENARRDDEAYRRGRVGTLLQSINALARALDAVEGKKQILYFSQGFDLGLLQGNTGDLSRVQEQGEQAAHGNYWNVDTDQRFGNTGLESRLDEVLTNLKRSDCVIHAVDLAGLVAGDESGAPGGKGGQASLAALSGGTGGELFKNANDFSGQLDRLLKTQEVVYVLTFTPRLTGHPGQFHALKVKVRRPGLSISARAGYFEPRPFAKVSRVEQRLSAADVIASGIPRNEIPAKVFVTPLPPEDPAGVPVVIQLAPLRPLPPGKSLPLEIYGYAFNDRGEIADYFFQRAEFDLARVGDTLEKEGLLFVSSLRLASGDYQLRVLVRNTAAGTASSSTIPLKVPQLKPAEPYLAGPVFMASGSRGLVLYARSERSGRGTAESPFTAGMNTFLPDFDPNLAAGSEARLCLYAYNAQSKSAEAKENFSAQLLDGKGQTVRDVRLELLGRSAPDKIGKATHLFRFKPGDLPPGDYVLRISLADPEGGGVRQALAPLRVRAAKP